MKLETFGLMHAGEIDCFFFVCLNRRGFRLTFEDRGPGIPDVEQALKDGYTTGSGLGLGLGGAKRLSNEFEIRLRPGEGTRISLTRWK